MATITTYACDQCEKPREVAQLWCVSITPRGAHYSPGTVSIDLCESCVQERYPSALKAAQERQLAFKQPR